MANGYFGGFSDCLMAEKDISANQVNEPAEYFKPV